MFAVIFTLIIIAVSVPVMYFIIIYFTGRLPCIAYILGLCPEVYVIPFVKVFINKDDEHTCLHKNWETVDV